TNRSSPTSWTLAPSRLVSLTHPSQSFSARPSSSDRIGYFAHHPAHRSIISSVEAILFLSLLKKQYPCLPTFWASFHSSLVAGSRATKICSPHLYPAFFT